MATRIAPTEQNTFTVNGKEVYKDMEGNWICKEKFSMDELRAWSNYKKLAIDGKRKQLTMTFKT